MRTFKLIAGLFFLLLVVACQDKKRSSQIKVAENESKYVVLAYVTSWGESTPDPACLTHINYAFGHVTDTPALKLSPAPTVLTVCKGSAS